MKVLLIGVLAGCVWASNTVPVNPMVGIDVRRDGRSYIFRFRNCLDSSKPVGIRRLTIAEKDQNALHCQLVKKDPGAAYIKEEWTYGSTPSGYESKVCQPLAEGHTYVVRVSGAGGGGAVFVLEEGGGVKTLEESCEGS